MQKIKFFSVLICLSILTLACASTTWQLHPIPAPAPPIEDIVMMVANTEQGLYVRTSPNGEISTIRGRQMYLINGDKVRLYAERTVGDTLWCAIAPDLSRWVACRYLQIKTP